MTTLSSKCADTNQDMLLSLGVSRPILNYVIFCHQEDSNWPLEEGSKVKDKFDEIFNSAKYQKCLKNIKDVRKVELDKAKLHKKDMEHYKSDKEYADSKAKELTRKQEELEGIEESVARLSAEMKPLVEQLQKLHEEEKGFAEIQKKLAEAQTSYDHVRTERERLEQQITELLPASMDREEIEEKRDGVLRETKKKEKELKDQEEALKDQDHQISEADSGMRKNAAEIGKALAEKEQHQNNLKERDVLIEQTSEEFGLDDDGNFASVLDKEEKKIGNQITHMRNKNRENESKIEEEIDGLKSSRTGLEERKKREQSDMVAQKREIAMIKRELGNLEGAAEKLEKIQSDWEEAGKKLEKEKSKHDLKSLSEEVDREKQTVRDLDNMERKVREELRSLDEKQGVHQKIAHYDEDIKTKQTRVEKILKKRNNEFLQLFETVPDKKRLKNRFKDTEEETEKRMRDIESRKATLEAESKSKRNLRKETKKILDKTSSRIQALEGQIGDILGPDEDLEEEITKAQDNLDLARKELSVKEARKFTNREMIDSMKQMSHPGCPTCQRAFKNKDEAKDLIEELEDEIRAIPNKVKSLESKVKSLQRKTELFQKARPQVHELKNLKTENDSQTKKIEEIDNEMKTFKKDIEDIDEDLSLTEATITSLKEVAEDVQQVDTLTRELTNLHEKREELNLQLDGSGSTRGIEEVRAEEENITTKLRVARKNLEKCQETVTAQTSLINELEAKRNNLTQKKLEIEGQQQQRTNMMEKKEELEQKVKVSESEVKRCTRELEPILEQLEETEARKRKSVAEGEKEVDKLVQRQRAVERSSCSLQKLDSSIESFRESGREGRVEKLKADKASLQREIDQLQKQKKLSEEKMSQLRVDVSNQESRRRMFSDNLRLREYQGEENKYRNQVAAREGDLENMNWKSVMERKEKISTKYNKISTEKSAKGGQLAEVSKTIKDMERELNNPKLKNAASKFKEMAIKNKLSLRATEDLDKYYRALDFAIMKYHKEKMKVVNTIIRELWRSTYKGNDIDYIEIKTTEDNEVSSGADKRKTYNYRVVMIKGGTEMDMRGRCSAGQKVLSSLIIRLALAETFSANCGIIALDEPTTNLDKENIESLAMALSDIVNKRSGQRNFQLVVITHDEEFIEELSRCDKVQHYQKVSRDQRGLSQIRKIAIADSY